MWACTADEARAFDARAIDRVGVPQPVLMENAGRGAAAVVQRLFADGPVLVLVGSGNNGGDALVVARSLAAWGREVRVVVSAERKDDDPLLHGWEVPSALDGDLDEAAWDDALRSATVVDGVLGTGVSGAPRARQAAVIERVVASGRPVVALDVPSGVDATTGAVPGAAMVGRVTVAFGVPKLGALLHPGRAYVGRHVVVEIGFPPLRPERDAMARVATPMWARAHLPRRGTDTHKNAVGRVTLLAGRAGMAGAAILSARGALSTGAGMVRVVSAASNRDAVHAAVPEALFVDAEDDGAVRDAVAAGGAVVAGPGWGSDDEGARILSEALSEGDAPCVLDADALNLVAAGALDGAALASRRPVLLTPHPGEMARLLPDGPSPTDERPACVRAAAERFGCAVLLKGAPSLVAAPDAAVRIDTQSASDLAVGGMGDVLAGVCGTLLAQGLAPATAGAVGLYLSGRAARLAGRGAGLAPSDVIRWLPDALREGGAPLSDLDLPFVLFDADAPR